jgi:hypothetical protein
LFWLVGDASFRPMTLLRTTSFGSLFAALTLGAACGGADQAPTHVDRTNALLADDSTSCPKTPPANGSSCSTAGLECSWGTDSRFGCRVGGTCGDSLAWDIWKYACPEPAPSCPTLLPSSSSACDLAQVGSTCVYTSGEKTTAYTCANCDGTLCMADNIWYVTDLATGCPDDVPNWGAACSSAGLTCNYDWCAGEFQCTGNSCSYVPWVVGTEVVCDNGAWTPGGTGACP